jgi:hypothetical protein
VRLRFLVPCLALCACSNRKSELAPQAATDAAVDAPVARQRLECLTIEGPPGSTTGAATGGGLAFHGAKQLHTGSVAYDPAFTVTTQAAEGADTNAVRDELLKSFTDDYLQTMRTVNRTGGLSAAALQPPRVTAAPVAGQPGHAWQIDSVASFNGERLPWRAYSMTAIFRDRVYVVTAAAALPNIGELKPIADRYFASIRFDACK